MPYQCFFVKTSAEVFSFIPSADGTPSADTAVRRWRRLYAQGERTQWPPSAAETPCPRRGNCRLRRQGEPPSGGGENAVPTAGGLPVFTGGNKRGQDTRYGFLSPLDSPDLPLR